MFAPGGKLPRCLRRKGECLRDMYMYMYMYVRVHTHTHTCLYAVSVAKTSAWVWATPACKDCICMSLYAYMQTDTCLALGETDVQGLHRVGYLMGEQQACIAQCVCVCVCVCVSDRLGVCRWRVCVDRCMHACMHMYLYTCTHEYVYRHPRRFGLKFFERGINHSAGTRAA